MKTVVLKLLVRWVGVVGFALALAVGVGARDVGPLAAIVQAQAERQHFMGSVLVAKGDTVVFEMSTGMANVEWNVPDSRTTKFRIASLTKQFTAAAILLLQEQGKLSIDDRLSKYLTDVPESWRPITLRQLLTHTSGVPDTDGSDPRTSFWRHESRGQDNVTEQEADFSYCLIRKHHIDRQHAAAPAPFRGGVEFTDNILRPSKRNLPSRCHSNNEPAYAGEPEHETLCPRTNPLPITARPSSNIVERETRLLTREVEGERNELSVMQLIIE